MNLCLENSTERGRPSESLQYYFSHTTKLAKLKEHLIELLEIYVSFPNTFANFNW